MHELISVIVPVYNVETYLEKCLNSILKQTYLNLEIIIVNDGSTDNSGEICKKFAYQDSRIKLINKKNGGLSDARNAGLDIITGNYIAFVDSDDFIDEDMIEFLYTMLKKNQADISICGKKSFINETEIIDFVEEQSSEIKMDKNTAFVSILKNDVIEAYIWNKLYSKKLFDSIRFPVGKVYEDIYTAYKLFYGSNCVIYSKQKKYNYRINPDGIVQSCKIKNEIDKVEAYKEIHCFCKSISHSLERLALNQYLKSCAIFIRIVFSKDENDPYLYEVVKVLKKRFCIYIFSKDCVENKLLVSFTIMSINLSRYIFRFLYKFIK